VKATTKSKSIAFRDSDRSKSHKRKGSFVSKNGSSAEGQDQNKGCWTRQTPWCSTPAWEGIAVPVSLQIK